MDKNKIGNILLIIAAIVLISYLIYKDNNYYENLNQKIENQTNEYKFLQNKIDGFQIESTKLRDTIIIKTNTINNFIESRNNNKPKFDSSYINAIKYLKQFANENIN